MELARIADKGAAEHHSMPREICGTSSLQFGDDVGAHET